LVTYPIFAQGALRPVKKQTRGPGLEGKGATIRNQGGPGVFFSDTKIYLKYDVQIIIFFTALFDENIYLIENASRIIFLRRHIP